MMSYRYLFIGFILVFFISCGSPSSFNPPKPDIENIDQEEEINQEERIEEMIEKIRKLQLGGGYNLVDEQTKVSKDYKNIFILRMERTIGNLEIVNYDISQDEPILLETIDYVDGRVLGIYPLDKKRVIILSLQVGIIVVNVYDYGKRYQISNAMIEPEDDDYFDIDLSPTVNKNVIYFGKGYGIDYSDVDNIRIINRYLKFYRDGLNNVVIDKVNNIMWEDHQSVTATTWKNSIDYCSIDTIIYNDDNTTKTILSGWRMPTYDELNSIIDENRANPATKEAFLYTIPDTYWSSTPSEQNSSMAFGVNMSNGTSVLEYKDQERYYMCVKEL